MRRFRSFVRGLFQWVVAPAVVLAALIAGFQFLFPSQTREAFAYCASQILIRTLALRAGTGWAGESFTLKADVPVAMRDGVRLSTDLFLPSSAGPHPAIMIRTPYTKAEGRLIGEFFARYGYAVAVQDTRGRHKSEGEFYPFRHEFDDGVDFVKWLRAQPWCNSRIGGFGASYLGFTQWTAVAGDAQLTSIAPTFIAGDLHSAIYKGGAFGQKTYLHWSLSSYGRFGDWQGAKNIERGYRHAPLIESDDVSLRDIDFYNDWASHPQRDEYWRRMSAMNRVDTIATPAFITAGWYDFMLDGQIRDFQEIRQNAAEPARRMTRLLVGPWSHSFFNVNLKNYGIERRWMEAVPFEFVRETKDWLDYSLKGAANGWDRRAAVRVYVLGANVWRNEESWPPRSAVERSYYLRSNGEARTLRGDGGLTTIAPAKPDPEDSFVFDPRDPVPTKGGGHGDMWTAGPVDQREVEERNDVLVYSSETLANPLLVMGLVKARIYAASTAPDTDFTAKLVDVFPDGRALIVCEGIIRARYREGPDRPKLMAPGVVYPFEIELAHTAVEFQKGHRIRLEISSSNAPRYDVNPNTGREIATERERIVATQRIFHGAEYRSALVLPVVE